LVVPADARTAVAVIPPDARAATPVIPADARVAVAAIPADARTRTPPLGPTPNDAEPTPDERVKELQQQARKAKRDGDSDGALLLLDQALAIKRTGTTLYQKAELLLSKGERAKALEAAKELTRVSPRRAQGWRMLGLASYEAEDYAGARKAFGRYLELSPNAKDRDDVLTLLESM
jgi:tetratricopeptide (TPR) repeat protein